MKITKFLRLPETKYLQDLDSPSSTLFHAKIIKKKSFLKRIYIDFYNQFKEAIPSGGIDSRLLVELGSGGGFIKDVIPDVITSDIINLPGVDRNFSALDMPFESATVDAYFMIDVLHHLKDVRVFFGELDRCLKLNGKIIMIEPAANTLWGRFIFKNFHHEQFDLLGRWGTGEDGRLSSANSAIPWIVFYRDRLKFEKEFPSLKVVNIKSHTPFRYLVSGGVSMRQLLPSFTYNIVQGIEIMLSPFNKYLGMFMTIEIEKVL